MNSDITYDLIILGAAPCCHYSRWSIGQEKLFCPEMERRRHLLELGLHPSKAC